MYYYFEKNKGKWHVKLDGKDTDLLDSFLQVEGASFADLIMDAIQEVKTSRQKSEFSGNTFSLNLDSNQALISDELGEQEIKLTSQDFISIFIFWSRLSRR